MPSWVSVITSVGAIAARFSGTVMGRSAQGGGSPTTTAGIGSTMATKPPVASDGGTVTVSTVVGGSVSLGTSVVIDELPSGNVPVGDRSSASVVVGAPSGSSPLRSNAPAEPISSAATTAAATTVRPSDERGDAPACRSSKSSAGGSS